MKIIFYRRKISRFQSLSPAPYFRQTLLFLFLSQQSIALEVQRRTLCYITLKYLLSTEVTSRLCSRVLLIFLECRHSLLGAGWKRSASPALAGLCRPRTTHPLRTDRPSYFLCLPHVLWSNVHAPPPLSPKVLFNRGGLKWSEVSQPTWNH